MEIRALPELLGAGVEVGVAVGVGGRAGAQTRVLPGLRGSKAITREEEAPWRRSSVWFDPEVSPELRAETELRVRLATDGVATGPTLVAPISAPTGS